MRLSRQLNEAFSRGSYQPTEDEVLKAIEKTQSGDRRGASNDVVKGQIARDRNLKHGGEVDNRAFVKTLKDLKVRGEIVRARGSMPYWKVKKKPKATGISFVKAEDGYEVHVGGKQIGFIERDESYEIQVLRKVGKVEWIWRNDADRDAPVTIPVETKTFDDFGKAKAWVRAEVKKRLA
jgi:hypothetical protein